MTKDQAPASILLINRVYPPASGATGRLLHDLARQFTRNGHQVTIITTTQNKSSYATRGLFSVRRVHAPRKNGLINWLSTLWRLYKAIMRTSRHDVMISLSDPPLLYVAAARAAKHKKSAYIHWCQDLYPDLAPVLGFNIPSFALRLADKWGMRALQSCMCVVCISRCMQRYIVHKGVSLRRTAVIENWPDMELINPPQKTNAPKPVRRGAKLPNAAALRSRRLYSDPTGQHFRVLYAGSIARAHPINAIVGAARILQKSQPDIELVFVGAGAGFDKLAAARAQYGLDNIRFMPHQPRGALKALMDSGDVHLVTMRDDALGKLLPSKFYAALAAARPIVFAGPPECDIAALIAKHGCGSVAAPNDSKAIANAIATYRADAQSWFDAHDGTMRALKGRTASDAFARWADVIKKVSK